VDEELAARDVGRRMVVVLVGQKERVDPRRGRQRAAGRPLQQEVEAVHVRVVLLAVAREQHQGRSDVLEVDLPGHVVLLEHLEDARQGERLQQVGADAPRRPCEAEQPVGDRGSRERAEPAVADAEVPGEEVEGRHLGRRVVAHDLAGVSRCNAGHRAVVGDEPAHRPSVGSGRLDLLLTDSQS
jgi:hypothetical protein